MKKKIKIFNSNEEAKSLEGTLIENVKIRDGNDPIENILLYLKGKFTPMQRLKNVIKNKAKEMEADYAMITNKYETFINRSGCIQNIEDCDKLLSVEVSFYKQ